MERWLERQEIFAGRVFSVASGTAALQDGTRTQRDVVFHNGGVAIAAVDSDHIVMIKQFRIAVNETLLELPAGMLESGEQPEARALKELAEETGYLASTIELMTDYYVSPGYTTERMRIYYATGLTYRGQALEGDERLEVLHVPLTEARRMLESAEVRDSKTIIGLRALFARVGD